MAARRARLQTILAIPAALVLTLALADCSDEGGAGPNDSDTTFDTAADTPPGDPDVDDDAADVPASDVVVDVEADVVADVESDSATEVGDAQDEVLVDGGDDVGQVDVERDLGTTQYPVCPYETESATADCATLCGAVGACSGEDAETFCTEFCAVAKSLLNQSAADAFGACMTGTPCDDVPEGQDLGGFCFVQTVSGLAANPDAVAACNAVDAAIETCTGEDDLFDAECNAIAPALRAEADEILLDCADEPCESIDDCVSAAVCDILL